MLCNYILTEDLSFSVKYLWDNGCLSARSFSRRVYRSKNPAVCSEIT